MGDVRLTAAIAELTKVRAELAEKSAEHGRSTKVQRELSQQLEKSLDDEVIVPQGVLRACCAECFKMFLVCLNQYVLYVFPKFQGPSGIIDLLYA